MTPDQIDAAGRAMLHVLAGISKTRQGERWINTTWESISEQSRDEYRRCVIAIAENLEEAGLLK